jgi:hypothetical protein
MLIVGRPINGISLNPLEYLLDARGYVIAFDSGNQAKRFLKRAGFTDDDIGYFTIEACKAFCSKCKHEFVLTSLYHDKPGWRTVCPDCENSFDVDIVPFCNRSRKALKEP